MTQTNEEIIQIVKEAAESLAQQKLPNVTSITVEYDAKHQDTIVDFNLIEDRGKGLVMRATFYGIETGETLRTYIFKELEILTMFPEVMFHLDTGQIEGV